MAVTLDQIKGFLDARSVNYEVRDENTLGFGISTEVYTNTHGVKGISLVVSLDENGEYFQLVAPVAFKGEGPNLPVFLQACMEIQWRTKLIQFEYDSSDGEVRPVIEFPLEDAPMTQKQFDRCVTGMIQLMDNSYPVLDKALKEGTIEFPTSKNPAAALDGMLRVLQEAARRGHLTPQQRDLLEKLGQSSGGDSGGGAPDAL